MSHKKAVQTIAVLALAAGPLLGVAPAWAQRGNLVIPQDSPANYSSWGNFCHEDQVASISMMITNLGLRMKALADNSKDLGGDADFAELVGEGYSMLGAALGDAAMSASGSSPPVAVALAVASGALNLTAGYAYYARNTSNSQIDKNLAEIQKLNGYLQGWKELLEKCEKKRADHADLTIPGGDPELVFMSTHKRQNLLNQVEPDTMRSLLSELSQEDRALTRKAAESGKLSRYMDTENRRHIMNLLQADGSFSR